MAIEWFDPKLGTPSVSIAEYGLTFNKAAIDTMGSPSRVMLGFDKEKNIVVVKALYNPTPEEMSKSFPFAERERNGYIRLTNKEFVRFILRYLPKIDLSKSVRCLAKWDEKQEYLIVDLSTGIEGGAEATEE